MEMVGVDPGVDVDVEPSIPTLRGRGRRTSKAPKCNKAQQQQKEEDREQYRSIEQ